MRYNSIFLFFLVGSISLFAQDSTEVSKEKLIIGLTETPPFVMEENGEFSGLSIASWEMVNERLESEYEYKTYSSLSDLLVAIEKQEVDFSINPITVTDRRMQNMDFSQPYFISHTGIAQKTQSQTWNFLKNLWSWDFISALLILVGVIFIFGFLVWLFERKKNKKEFGEDARGIWQGFWWSAVTMTTVGYGDKSPRTFGGRIIGLIWMFMAVIMISSLTAGIASSLTVRGINDQINNIRDLERFSVTTVSGSSAEELLELYKIESDLVQDKQEGMQNLLEKKTTLFVYDEPILRYEINRSGLEDELEVLSKTLKKDYYSYSFPKDSPFLKKIDPILMGTLKTMEWSNLVSEYQ